MTSEHLVEDYAEDLFFRDNPDRGWPGPDGAPSYMIEAEIALAQPVAQWLQKRLQEKVREP